MKGLGITLTVIAVLFLAGWGCHDWLMSRPDFCGTAPTELLPLLLWTALMTVVVLLGGALGLVYVALHALVHNDTIFMACSLGIGIILMLIGRARSDAK